MADSHFYSQFYPLVIDCSVITVGTAVLQKVGAARLASTRNRSEFFLATIFIRINSRKNKVIASVMNIVQKINIQLLYSNVRDV